MATISTRSSVYSFVDFCSIVEDGLKADLINGVIYMALPDSLNADDLFGWLRAVSLIYVRRKHLGKIVGSRVAFRLGAVGGPEPDIGFIRKERMRLLKGEYVNGAPDLAMEIFPGQHHAGLLRQASSISSGPRARLLDCRPAGTQGDIASA